MDSKENFTSKRIWEIDLLRSLAIVLMIIFHFIYDLDTYTNLEFHYAGGFWYWEGKSAALLFIFLAGISSGLSKQNKIKVGLKIFGYGMIITVVTYIALGQEFVRFGILHFLGVCMIMYPTLYLVRERSLLWLAAIIAPSALIIHSIYVDTSLLLPFGFTYPGFMSVDYYPLSPYLAVFILGIVVYKRFYYHNRSLFSFSIEHPMITWVSKHSLIIYLIHQPILIAIILFVKHMGIFQ